VVSRKSFISRKFSVRTHIVTPYSLRILKKISASAEFGQSLQKVVFVTPQPNVDLSKSPDWAEQQAGKEFACCILPGQMFSNLVAAQVVPEVALTGRPTPTSTHGLQSFRRDLADRFELQDVDQVFSEGDFNRASSMILTAILESGFPVQKLDLREGSQEVGLRKDGLIVNLDAVSTRDMGTQVSSHNGGILGLATDPQPT
jgi:hypothetical protein